MTEENKIQVNTKDIVPEVQEEPELANSYAGAGKLNLFPTYPTNMWDIL
jgi:hypothetical protein